MTDGPEAVSSVDDSIAENVHKVVPSSLPPRKYSFQGLAEGKSVHELLGGGKTADVLLWREKHLSAALLIGTTVLWVLFHWLQYTLLSVTFNLLLFTMVILFGWSNAASLLNRSPPHIPHLQLSEETIRHTAKTLHFEINKALLFIHNVALGKDFMMFLKVSASLWILSVLGGWCNLLTLIYMGVVIALTFPVVFDKYETEINRYSKILLEEAKKQYKKIDELVLRKLPKASHKDRKTQ